METPEKSNPWKNIEDFQQTPKNETDLLASTTFAEPDYSIKEQKIPETYSKKKSPWKKIITIVIIVIFFSGLTALGAFGIIAYEKSSETISALSLLPADPNLVLTVTINPNSSQFEILESNLQKFPGYKTFQKSFDKTGKGKTVSEFFQDKANNYDLDLEQDLLPALDDKAYIVINDLSPIGAKLQKDAILTMKEKMDSLSLAKGESQKTVAVNDIGSSVSAVLGASKENDVFKTNSKTSYPSVDFITAIKIKDFSKAQEILAKIQKNSRYQVTEKNYLGYKYYEVSLKSSAGNDDFLYEKLFGSIIGKNWIAASKEDGIRDVIEKANNASFLRTLLKRKTSESLESNNNFKAISESLDNSIGKDQFVSAYIKLNFDAFFKKDTCSGASSATCENITDYIKYPEDFIMGFDLRFNNDGIGITAISNQRSLKGVQNSPFVDGFVERIPQQVDNRWTDVFVEYVNPGDIYYNFKKNNLTDKGLKQWENTLTPINNAMNIDFESDIIDQIDGNIGIMLFAKRNVEPEGAIIMRVKDGQKMYSTIEKISEALKAELLRNYSSMNSRMFSTKDPAMLKYQNDMKKKMADLANAKLSSTETPEGKIYSFRIPDSQISFDFSIENNELIFASHYAAVESLLKSAKTSSPDSLVKNPLYIRSQSYSPTEGYAQAFVVPQGVINAISYTIQNSLINAASEFPSDPALQQAKMDDIFYPFSAILRTIKFIRTSATANEDSVRSSIFFDIKELPAAEKERAEQVLSQVQDGNF